MSLILNDNWDNEGAVDVEELMLDTTTPPVAPIEDPTAIAIGDNKDKGKPVVDDAIDESLLIGDGNPDNVDNLANLTDDDAVAQRVAFTKATIAYLKQEGVFTSDKVEEFDGTPEGLKVLYEAELTEWKDGFIESRHPLVAELEKRLEEFGDDYPIENLLNIKSNQLNYAKITEDTLKDNTVLGKELYKTYLKETTKFSPATIDRMVTRAEEDFTLMDVVKDEALPGLKAREVEKESELNRITAAEQKAEQKVNADRLASYKDTLAKTEELIPGVKITKKEQEDLFKAITTPVAVDGFKNPVSYATAVYMKDPAKFDIALNYLLHKTKNFTDFSTIINTATTKAVKQIDETLVRGIKATKVNPDGSKTVDKSNPIDEFYKSFPQLKTK